MLCIKRRQIISQQEMMLANEKERERERWTAEKGKEEEDFIKTENKWTTNSEER